MRREKVSSAHATAGALKALWDLPQLTSLADSPVDDLLV
jgi:hypothetical protein